MQPEPPTCHVYVTESEELVFVAYDRSGCGGTTSTRCRRHAVSFKSGAAKSRATTLAPKCESTLPRAARTKSKPPRGSGFNPPPAGVAKPPPTFERRDAALLDPRTLLARERTAQSLLARFDDPRLQAEVPGMRRCTWARGETTTARECGLAPSLYFWMPFWAWVAQSESRARPERRDGACVVSTHLPTHFLSW